MLLGTRGFLGGAGTRNQMGRPESRAEFDVCELMMPLWPLGQDAVKLGYVSFQPWKSRLCSRERTP